MVIPQHVFPTGHQSNVCRIGALVTALLMLFLLLSIATASASLQPEDAQSDSATSTSILIEEPVVEGSSDKHRLHAQIKPKPDPAAATYRWTPEPLAGQGTDTALYDQNYRESWDVTVNANLQDGTEISATKHISVHSHIHELVSSGSIDAQPATSINRYETLTATLTLESWDASRFGIIWSPSPRQGQGKHEAVFAWGSPGEKTITATIGGTSHHVVVTQTVTVDQTSVVDERFIYLPMFEEDGTASASEVEIIGGEEAEPGAWPWQAVLMVDPTDAAAYFCGGTLIAPEWVLTAAHCVEWWQYGMPYVVLGRHRLSSGDGEAIQVQSIWMHPAYNGYTADYDIALLKLSAAATATPLPVHVDAFEPGEMATVIGWGQTNPYDNNSDSDVLMQVSVPIVSDSACYSSYGSSITDNMFCAGQSGKDSCYGDSGGPLMAPSDQSSGWSQIGIVSWGYGCGEAGYPGVYTRLSNFTDWIADYVGDEPQPSGDDYEADDTLGSANGISTDGVVQTHNFHIDGDVDWVWFQATSGYTYTVETSNLAEDNDTILRLYDPGRAEVDRDNDSGEGKGSRLVWVATETGKHYARVSSDGELAEINLSYDLSVTEEAVSPDGYEDDDNYDSANPLQIDGAAQRHTFHVVGDQDWLYFDAEPGVIYRIETQDLSGDADTVLHLYDAWSDELTARDDDGNGGGASRIDWMADSKERIYVRVKNYDASVAGEHVRYDIQVGRVLDPGSGHPYEFNDEQADATPISTDGTSQTHDFYVGSDRDWLRFDVVEGTLYAVETDNLLNESDTVLRLHNGEYSLRSDDDSGIGLGSRLLWQVESDGTLYARVHHTFADASGADTAYNVKVTAGEGIAYPYEPDDSLQQAHSIDIDTLAQRRDFHQPGDVDWISFEAEMGTSYRIETSALGANTDTVLSLHDTTGVEIALDDDGGDGFASRIDWTAPESGTFYLSVRHYVTSIGGPFVQYEVGVFKTN